MNFKGFLQVFVETPNYKEAFEVTVKLLDSIQTLLSVHRIEFEKSWKTDSHFGITVHLEDKKLPNAYQKILELLGNNWEIQETSENSSSAVWNAGKDNIFIDSRVRRATFEYWLEAQ